MQQSSPQAFGNVHGINATEYTLENARGTRLSVTDYGARITHLLLPNADGSTTDVVLGYDSAQDYAATGDCFGAICGRYANRLADARFTLNGKTYALEANDRGNTLHGGSGGFQYRFFTVEQTVDALRCTLVSKDGDMGFPGTLTLTVIYQLTNDNVLRIRYDAVCPDADTIANFTNHSYFNLDGSDSILDHTLQVNADFYTPTDTQQLPTGEILAVSGTGFDLRKPVRLGDRLRPVHGDLSTTNGYDHNFVLHQAKRGLLTHAATLISADGKRVMECHTTLPGLQVYTANGLNAENGRGGRTYGQHAAVCLETQLFPNAMAQSHFPSPILRRGEHYTALTEYRFLDLSSVR